MFKSQIHKLSVPTSSKLKAEIRAISKESWANYWPLIILGSQVQNNPEIRVSPRLARTPDTHPSIAMLPVNKYILKNEKRSKSGLKGPQCHKKKFVVNGMEAMYKDTDTPTGNNLFLCNPSDGANKAAQVICERYALGENYGCAAAP